MNPPYFERRVKVAPAPFTEAGVAEQAVAWLQGVGQQPILEQNETSTIARN